MNKLNTCTIIDLLLSDYSEQEQRILRNMLRCRPMELQSWIRSCFGDRLQELRKGFYILR
jgi:hypothetical protein